MICGHGGNIYRNKNVIDFSANINPLGMPESIKKAVIGSADMWERYPDPECTELIGGISRYEKTAADKTVCGNGAADIIYRIFRAFSPRSAVLYAPCFSEYEKAAGEIGCNVFRYCLKDENDFFPDDGIVSLISEDTDIVFICSPNNPTGKLIPPDILKKISDRCAVCNTLLVCDECFLGFCMNGEKFSLRSFMTENTVILKAFTKLYAIPGLRLGYALFGSAENAEKVRCCGQCWGVSVPAQAAGIAALSEKTEKDFISKTREYISAERKYLIDILSECGIKCFSSDANYILIKAFAGLDDLLLKKNILIRNCGDFHGLSEEYYRIAVRRHDENIILADALREIL